MKQFKHKILSTLSVLAIGASAFALAAMPAKEASAETKSVTPSTVLSVSDAENTSFSLDGTSYAAMKFTNGAKVTYRNDLAYRWFEGKGEEKFFSMELAFADENFEAFTVTFESKQNSKTDDTKTTNEITFTNENGKVFASVNGEEKVALSAKRAVISFTLGEKAGVFNVLLNGEEAGTFENIGGYFAEYTSSSVTPITFSATVKENSSTEVALVSLNGQSFALNEEGKIEDNASPVLVVNQSLSSFRLGRTFALDYEVIDVLDATVSKSMEYYQYSPSDESVKYETLSSSKVFFKKQGVDENFVSVRFTLNDDDSSHEKIYEAAWYADPDCVATIEGVDYVPLLQDENAPSYVCIEETENDYGVKVNVLNTQNEAYLAYQEAVKEAAENLAAGSGNYFYLPSLQDLIFDEETAYSSLSFNIYYKTQKSSTSSSNTNLSSSALSIQTSSVGYYTFRVVPADDSGNVMKLYKDGRKVAVNNTNVWDFDCIPEFSFTAYNNGIKIDATTEQKSGYVNQTYSFSSFTIKGISGYQTNYSLYYFEGATKETDLTYSKLVEMANEEKTAENPYGAFAKYLEAKEGLYFRPITATGVSDADSDYAWNGSASSFVPQEAGYYILAVEVVDGELWGNKVVGYQVIDIASERDVVEGETYWLKNNYVSVIFFSLAGVALVAIVVLLVVKPKEENLEEIDLEKVGKKKEKKSKKSE